MNNPDHMADLALDKVLDALSIGKTPSDHDALALADCTDLPRLLSEAERLRDEGFGKTLTYSRKVFIPLTQLCRDVCHYCTFAKTPKTLAAPYLTLDEVLAIAQEGADQGCKEALFTLGERPEERYAAAREWLEENGYASTLEYVRDAAKAVFEETGLFPHLNPGCLTRDEILMLRPYAGSMGTMLESASPRLCEKGMPHFGSPDKTPEARLEALRVAGEAMVPFTSGILIGIGETRTERVESLLALRALSEEFGHIQEIIIQNFRAKPETKMALAPEPDLDELLWTIAVARLIFGKTMSLQVPPNLSPGGIKPLIAAGLNDWGGISPVTADHVNPEAPWPHIGQLTQECASEGFHLCERLTTYPSYLSQQNKWLDKGLHAAMSAAKAGDGLARESEWYAGANKDPNTDDLSFLRAGRSNSQTQIEPILDKAQAGLCLEEDEIARLLTARGREAVDICYAANELRREVCGDDVTYAVNRNINYTNICTYHCTFCAFSKGKTHENLRGPAYDISHDEIVRRAIEAWQRGATEVCLQGGIHPSYDGNTYLDICRAIKDALPDIHIHAFSPLEVYQGATTLGLSLAEYYRKLKDAGLGTLPGTAAEILDDEVRKVLCPDKLTTDLWLEIISEAHNQGFNTTATIMYGHIEKPIHSARHLLRIRDLQEKSLKAGKGKFTEFVPLPFVHMEAPMFLKAETRKGPTFREAVLLHAVARLVFHPVIPNIQVSWTKMGVPGVRACLEAGVNDLGGTLMNESISRAAGASNGQELPPEKMEAILKGMGRAPIQRTTQYGLAPAERRRTSFDAGELTPVVNELQKRPRSAAAE
jgi:FO synthase